MTRAALVVVGPPASGKTTVGTALADDLGAVFRDTDHDIEVASGSTVADLFVSEGEPHFRALEERAVAAALARREKGAGDDDLLERLAADDRLHLSRSDLEATVADPVAFTGAAGRQVAAFVRRAEDLAARFPGAAGYRPEPIL